MKKFALFVLLSSFFVLNAYSGFLNGAYDNLLNPCGACQGSGQVVCYLCGGAGGSNSYRCMTVPPYSSYYVWITCNGCGGNGVVSCPYCYGTGRVKNVQSSGNVSKGRSSGRGTYNNGSSSSSSSSSSQRTCSGCRGTGRCTLCKGQGWYWEDTGTYTGSSNKKKVTCPSCRGDGKCGVCYGRGSIRY